MLRIHIGTGIPGSSTIEVPSWSPPSGNLLFPSTLTDERNPRWANLVTNLSSHGARHDAWPSGWVWPSSLGSWSLRTRRGVIKDGPSSRKGACRSLSLSQSVPETQLFDRPEYKRDRVWTQPPRFAQRSDHTQIEGLKKVQPLSNSSDWRIGKVACAIPRARAPEKARQDSRAAILQEKRVCAFERTAGGRFTPAQRWRCSRF